MAAVRVGQSSGRRVRNKTRMSCRSGHRPNLRQLSVTLDISSPLPERALVPPPPAWLLRAAEVRCPAPTMRWHKLRARCPAPNETCPDDASAPRRQPGSFASASGRSGRGSLGGGGAGVGQGRVEVLQMQSPRCALTFVDRSARKRAVPPHCSAAWSRPPPRPSTQP